MRSLTLEARSVRRARIVLLAADGVGNHEIARRLEISRGQVIAWRGRFAQGGVAAIESDLQKWPRAVRQIFGFLKRSLCRVLSRRSERRLAEVEAIRVGCVPAKR